MLRIPVAGELYSLFDACIPAATMLWQYASAVLTLRPVHRLQAHRFTVIELDLAELAFWPSNLFVGQPEVPPLKMLAQIT